MDCIFCKIVAGEIPSKTVFENERILVFYDIAPMAPVHLLAIPKVHIASAAEITADDSAVVSEIFKVLAQLAREFGLDKSGFRIVTNHGEDGCQSVPHLHFHLLGGKKLPADLGK